MGYLVLQWRLRLLRVLVKGGFVLGEHSFETLVADYLSRRTACANHQALRLLQDSTLQMIRRNALHLRQFDIISGSEPIIVYFQLSRQRLLITFWNCRHRLCLTAALIHGNGQ